MRTTLMLLLACALTACATPSTLLKNESTGQLARCGGDSTGSMTGGYIGYSISKSQAEQCVQDYQRQGFAVVERHD